MTQPRYWSVQRARVNEAFAGVTWTAIALIIAVCVLDVFRDSLIALFRATPFQYFRFAWRHLYPTLLMALVMLLAVMAAINLVRGPGWRQSAALAAAILIPACSACSGRCTCARYLYVKPGVVDNWYYHSPGRVVRVVLCALRGAGTAFRHRVRDVSARAGAHAGVAANGARPVAAAPADGRGAAPRPVRPDRAALPVQHACQRAQPVPGRTRRGIARARQPRRTTSASPCRGCASRNRRSAARRRWWMRFSACSRRAWATACGTRSTCRRTSRTWQCRQ